MKAICINNTGSEMYLTVGKEYEVEEYFNPSILDIKFYMVHNTDSDVHLYGKQNPAFIQERFKLI